MGTLRPICAMSFLQVGPIFRPTMKRESPPRSRLFLVKKSYIITWTEGYCHTQYKTATGFAEQIIFHSLKNQKRNFLVPKTDYVGRLD